MIAAPPRPPRPNSAVIILGAVAIVAIGAGAVVSAEYLYDRTYGETSRGLAMTKAEFRSFGAPVSHMERTGDHIELPRPAWAPDDAGSIGIQWRNGRPSESAYMFRSETGVDLSKCTRLPDDSGGPALESTYLPTELPKRPWTCGDGRALWEEDGLVYSWATQFVIDPS